MIQIGHKNNKSWAKIEELHNWERNPRDIKEVDFERAKKQIKRNKQITGEWLFEPLLITPDGEILGGNMRLRVLRELGVKYVWVSLVNPKTNAEKLEIALAANDRWGFYVEDELTKLVQECGLELDLDAYKVDLEEALSLKDLLNQPIVDEELLDNEVNKETEKKMITCPECGHQFQA